MFYTYNQNNSGGSFVSDKELAEYVIIEAGSSEEANKTAEELGIYFDGCEKGMDCSCCGDRWYEVDADDGKKRPLIYGKPPKKILEDSLSRFNKQYIIYYKNGAKEASDS